MEMWKETCPIHAEIRPWFKDKSLEDLGRKYWKKKSYVFQGFVVDTKLQEDTTPENPIRRFIVNPSIFNIVKGALMDPEMDNLFTDYENGTDFRLTKTTKGQYADYSTSSFARKERGLNEVELQAVADKGLFNLNDFMPKKPTKEEVDIIYDMFKASVDGELYDPKRWGQHFKPAGVNLGNLGVASDVDAAESSFKAPAPAARPSPVAAPKPTVVDDEDDAPFETADATAAPEGKKNVNDILAMIRNRQQK
jgi:outer membrane protein OmpA-like peptidoglycan-associated protein